MPQKKIDAILLLYNRELWQNASTIMEYVNAIVQLSGFPVVSVNTELGFPSVLHKLQFHSIILHYSLFGIYPYRLNKRFYQYLANNQESFKLAIFQDEYRFCQQRFKFINEYKINFIYTCIAEEHVAEFYGKYTPQVPTKTALTGYVSDELTELADRITRPDELREIDISYRGRPVHFYMGKGAQEKVEIARGFRERAAGLDLNLDIKIGEEDRIYGAAWYEFLANSRGVLGVESGVSFCDVEDRVRPAVESLLMHNPEISFDEVYERVLKSWEGNIPIRTISPRHFEAAALRVCQVLFEGEYAGIMKPMVHYIPLKKDFSNFDEVIRAFRDPQVRHIITENAYRDLIASGEYSYQVFIERLDNLLVENGLESQVSDESEIRTIAQEVQRAQNAGRAWKTLENRLRYSKLAQKYIKPVLRPQLEKVRSSNAQE